MRITKHTLTLLRLLQCGGLNARLRGWNRMLRVLFPISHQMDSLIYTTYRGHRYAAAPNHFVDWEVLVTGGYEIEDLKLYAAFCAALDMPLVLDVGANVGHHSFTFASMGCRVIAFEPNPALWPIIKSKISFAGLQNIELHEVGLGDRTETRDFAIPISTNSGTGQFIGEGNCSVSTLGKLPITLGDEYLTNKGLHNVDIVKIDIQGFERQALRGLKETLLRNRPVVGVEIGDENRLSIPTLSALQELLPPDYIYYRLQTDILLIFKRAYWVKLTPPEFKFVDGNVFCVPREKSFLMEKKRTA